VSTAGEFTTCDRLTFSRTVECGTVTRIITACYYRQKTSNADISGDHGGELTSVK